jgi:nucleotide-binding universal stress UspA family protein
MRFQTLLVPLDLAGCAADVCTVAAALAAPLGASVVLLCVVHLPTGVSPDVVVHPHGDADESPALDALHADARAQLAPLLSLFREAGVPVGTTLRAGDVVDTILDTATRLDADLLVMGTHGRTGLERFVLGSVAEQVLRRAPCPVTVVRAHAPATLLGETAVQRHVGAEADG